MSAEALGNDLLQGLKEESLDVVLRSLRSSFDPQTARIGISALENLLSIFQNPSTAHPPREARDQSTPWSTEIPRINAQPTKENPPVVIEITGASSCSGKTQLLYHIILNTLLPPSHDETHLQGKGQAVVLFDLSSKFSLPRLHHMMHCYISTKSSTSGSHIKEDDIASLIHASLTQLHIFRPHSTPSFLATLSTLSTYLLAQPSSHFSASRPLGLLAISDLSAFYQQDRQESDEAATTATVTTTSTVTDRSKPAQGAHATSLLQDHYATLTTALRDLQLLFSSPPVVATNTALSTPANQRTRHPSLRPHLPGVWNNFCTLQVVVERDRVTKFGPGMSVEEASRERAQRWEVVSRSGFSGWVNWWGSGGWREEVKEGLRSLERGGRFNFWVRDEGVFFNDDGGEEKD